MDPAAYQLVKGSPLPYRKRLWPHKGQVLRSAHGLMLRTARTNHTPTHNSQTSFLYVIRSVLFYFHIVSAAYTFLILLSLHIVHKAKVHEARGAKYDAVCFTLDNNNKMILFGAAK